MKTASLSTYEENINKLCREVHVKAKKGGIGIKFDRAEILSVFYKYGIDYTCKLLKLHRSVVLDCLE